MMSSTFRSILVAATFFASPAIAQTIENFDIIYKNITTNFQNNVVHEITLTYDIGKDRAYEVALFDKDCIGAIAGTITDVTINKTAGSTANHDGLVVMIDLDKTTITASNIWEEDESLEFCVRLQLLLGTQVIKEHKKNVDITFDLSVEFETASVQGQSPSLTTGSGEANVGTYVKACKCDNFDSFKCNTSPLTPNAILYVCVMSINPDVEIEYVNELGLFQGSDALEVVASTFIQYNDISIMDVKNITAVGIATIVPSRFFSYGGVSDIKVNGTVEMKLVGSARRLFNDPAHDASPIAFDMANNLMTRGGEYPSAFGFSIQAEPAEAIPNVEWSVTYVSGSSGTIKTRGIAYFAIGAFTCFVWAIML